MKVVWSPLAIQRVVEIAEFIRRDRPRVAERWVEGVFAAVERLKKFPLSGREVEELHREEVREIVFQGCRIIHRVEHTRVVILTVRQGVRHSGRCCVSAAAGRRPASCANVRLHHDTCSTSSSAQSWRWRTYGTTYQQQDAGDTNGTFRPAAFRPACVRPVDLSPPAGRA
jgi:toxin ParE1/3/4